LASKETRWSDSAKQTALCRQQESLRVSATSSWLSSEKADTPAVKNKRHVLGQHNFAFTLEKNQHRML
jgi:hypothetical protein